MARTPAFGTAMALPLGVAGLTTGWADRLTPNVFVVQIAAWRETDGE